MGRSDVMIKEVEYTMEDVSEGIILNADFGYGMKFNDSENLYLKLEIQDFNGYSTIQLFNMENIPQVLKQFQSDVYPAVSIQSLIHRKVFLLNLNKIKGTPSAITAKNPDNEDVVWICNNDWD